MKLETLIGKIAVFLIISMHIAGFAGLYLYPLFFRDLVPFNLLASFAMLLYFHKDWNKSFYFLLLFSCTIGYLIEVLGVSTGKIFGVYHYGQSLGFKIMEVPPLIGLNWFVLLYTTGSILASFKMPWVISMIGGALMMTGLDVLIEPVAIRQDFWYWEGGIIPLQNFIAWFMIALCLHGIWCALEFDKSNKVAVWIYTAQFLFFLAHNITYWQIF